MTESVLPIKNIAAYQFVDLDRLTERRKRLRARGRELDLRGTILLSREGINLFLAGRPESIDLFLDELRQEARFAELEPKVSFSDRVPFRRLLVKIKREIISFDIPDIRPADHPAPKLAPHVLKQWLDQGKPITLLDVRNQYEVKLGTFDQAIPIGIDHFRDFPAKVSTLPEDLKQRPVVMFCTGGIRCEKAGPYMQRAGFEHVYQLDGGILKYFEECGGEHYRGECFVFDQRVALNAALEETETTMCFACQAPLTANDQASPWYVLGKSCPFCYQSPDETMQQTIERRQASLRQHVTPLPGSIPYENRRPMTVPQRCHGLSVWHLITELHPHADPAQWHEAIAHGRLQRGGCPVTAETVVAAGERIENVIPSTVEPDVNANIEILHEDEMLIVVNKPAPLPMHPCGRFNRNTLISILDQVYHPFRLRVAHRLDANTTGVVALSRSRPIARLVQPQFERGEVSKRYLARVVGHPEWEEYICTAAIGDQPRPLGRREVSPEGQIARTEFHVLRRDADQTALLEVRPLTGRTNQIRLHLAHLGFPIQGDPLYGPRAVESDGSPVAQSLPTLGPTDPPLCLHAWQLAFRHPADDKPVRFTAPRPAWSV